MEDPYADTQPNKRQKTMESEQKVQNAFRKIEKKYKWNKSSKVPTDYSDVIDFSSLSNNTPSNLERIVKVNNGVFAIKGIEGALSATEQLFWASESLHKYPNAPQNTNLTPFYGKLDNLFQKAESSLLEAKGKTYKFKNKDSPLGMLHQLRWATLGYHYNWTTRKYEPENSFPFPSDLAEFISKLASKVGCEKYKPEAAIVNYYHEDSTLCGHLDEAELTFDEPIVSISIGLSAVFLIGGKTRDKEPTAMFVRSGDVVVMGGDSRLCYHGVPRVIQNSLPEALLPNNVQDEKLKSTATYLQHSRININVRQVYKEQLGVDSLGLENKAEPVSSSLQS